MFRYLAFLIAALLPMQGWGQATVLQGGSWTSGRVPTYSSSGGGTQPVVQQSAPASGPTVANSGISELNVTARGTGTAPYVAQGTGQLGTIFQVQDAPTANATGYHALSFSANVNSGGLIAYNAFGGASSLPLRMNINGSTYEFPFALSGVVGPATSTVGHWACWNNTSGTLLSDCTSITSPTFTTNATISGTAPTLNIDETDQAVGDRRWLVRSTGSTFAISASDDAGGTVQTAIGITRLAGVPQRISFSTSGTTISTWTEAGDLLIGAVVDTARVRVAGDRSFGSWTVGGVGLQFVAATYTDTTGAGAITNRVGHSFGTPTFASTSPVTLTNAYTLYVAGAPVAGSNTTITNAFAARFDGNVQMTSNLIVGSSASAPTFTVSVPAAGSFGWIGRSQITSPANGNILLQDNAAANFGMVLLGGSTAAFPALKRNATALHVRLADDSAFAPLNAAAITGTGLLTGLSATPIAAGSSAQAFVKASSTADLGVYYGTGDPAFSAAKGSLYVKTNATTTTTRLWINTDGGSTWTFFTSNS